MTYYRDGEYFDDVLSRRGQYVIKILTYLYYFPCTADDSLSSSTRPHYTEALNHNTSSTQVLPSLYQVLLCKNSLLPQMQSFTTLLLFYVNVIAPITHREDGVFNDMFN